MNQPESGVDKDEIITRNGGLISTMKECYNYFFSNTPIVVQYGITERCNSRCRQCRFWRKGWQNKISIKDELTLEEIRKVFSDLYELGVRYVQLTGGEAFLRTDIKEVIKTLSDKGFRIVVATSGFLLNEKLIKELSTIKHLQILISLDSLNRELYKEIRGVDAIFTVLKNLKLVKKYFGHARMQMTVSSLNYLEINNMLKFCKENGYYVSFYPYDGGKKDRYGFHDDLLNYDNKKKKIADIFYRLAEKCKNERYIFGTAILYKKFGDWILGKDVGRCSAGRDNIVLGYDGNVYFCYKFDTVGNIRERSIIDIYNAAFLDKDNVKKIELCNKNTPCFFGCLRGNAIIRENKWQVIFESLNPNKIVGHVESFLNIRFSKV